MCALKMCITVDNLKGVILPDNQNAGMIGIRIPALGNPKTERKAGLKAFLLRETKSEAPGF